MNKIAITIGDFNGIGPEIVIKALNALELDSSKIILIGASELLNGLKNKYEIVEVPFSRSWLQYGKETKYAGEFSFKCLEKACELVNTGVVSSIVTAPVSKNAMNLAGYHYSGQTEVLQELLAQNDKQQKAEMLFVCGDFRVLLLTRHLALKDVCISKDLLIEKISRIKQVLNKNFNIVSPQIALCSLNPHAGENGVLGTEEIEEFLPAIAELRDNGISVSDPIPSDAIFFKAANAIYNKEKQPYHVYCACYHDQGLIPMKLLAQDSAVNMTVGLRVIRTSPAHGTAYDIAGKNVANPQSMICAIKEVL